MGIPVADLLAGVFAAIAVLAGVEGRRETGRGEHFDVAMFDVMVEMLAHVGTLYLNTGLDQEPQGSAHPFITPWQAFRCADDAYIVVAPREEHFWTKLRQRAGRPGVARPPGVRRGAVAAGAPRRAAAGPRGDLRRNAIRGEWLEVLQAAGVPAAPVNRMPAVFDDPQRRRAAHGPIVPDGRRRRSARSATRSRSSGEKSRPRPRRPRSAVTPMPSCARSWATTTDAIERLRRVRRARRGRDRVTRSSSDTAREERQRMTSTIRIGVVQTRAETDDPPKNVERALTYVEQAAALGARIVCLPETYPGPWTPPLDYDALPKLARPRPRSRRLLDRRHDRGGPGPTGAPTTTRSSSSVPTAGGGRYRRTTPEGPVDLRGRHVLGLRLHGRGRTLPVFDIGDCTIGMLDLQRGLRAGARARSWR